MPDAQLRIAGECHTDPAYSRSIQEAVQSAGLEKNVICLEK